MVFRVLLGWALSALLLASSTAWAKPSPQSRLEGWSSVIIAADWRDGEGNTIEAFDNARTDLSSAFLRAGFPQDLHRSLTLNPEKADGLEPAKALEHLRDVSVAASKGCFLYITSHGAPQRIVFGNSKGLEPVDLARMLRMWCGAKPTFVVLSACFSGSFVDALKGPNRIILTSAHRDRTSFGCGADERYPWFDGCVIQNIEIAVSFSDLINATRGCVSLKEAEAGILTPSEPQLYIGAEMQFRLPTLRFNTLE